MSSHPVSGFAGDGAARWLVARSPRLCRAVAYGVAILVAGAFAVHLLRGSLAYLGLLEDDYFYYSLVADNLVRLGKLTYDGITSTNGFHPLWFLLVLVMRLAAGGLNGAFYLMLALVFFASMVAVYELSRAFARSLGASAAMAPAIALVYCVAADRIVATGMETALDVPLMLWLLVELARTEPLTSKRAARLGLVASLAILARLDIALVVLIAFGAWLAFVRPSLAELRRVAPPFCAAGAAVPLYAAYNVVAFGSLLPMSAMAKQLVKRAGVNVPYVGYVATQTPFGSAAGSTLVAGAVAALVLWRRRRSGQPGLVPAQALFVGGVVLAFTFVFFGANALTGWTFFGWYAYPLVASLLASLVFVGALAVVRLGPAWRLRASAGAVAFLLVLASYRGVRYFTIFGLKWSVDDNGLLAMSIDLADRMHDHDGVYGMGAIGGFASYVLKKPVVQLEGLVADRAMIEHVRAEDELGSVLRAYHVDYLVVSKHNAKMEKHDGCYVVTQPDVEWAGDRVAKMHGEICAEPVTHFATTLPQHPWSQFSTLDTYVFDVRPGASWGPR